MNRPHGMRFCIRTESKRTNGISHRKGILMQFSLHQDSLLLCVSYSRNARRSELPEAANSGVQESMRGEGKCRCGLRTKQKRLSPCVSYRAKALLFPLKAPERSAGKPSAIAFGFIYTVLSKNKRRTLPLPKDAPHCLRISRLHAVPYRSAGIWSKHRCGRENPSRLP